MKMMHLMLHDFRWVTELWADGWHRVNWEGKNAGFLKSRSKHFITDRLFSTTRFGWKLVPEWNLCRHQRLFTGPPQTFWLRLCKRIFSDNVVYQLEMNEKIPLVRRERNSWKAETTLRYSNRYPRTLDLIFYSSKLRTRKNLQLFKCKWH